MKKIVFGVLIAAVVSSLIFAGCAAPAAPAPVTPAPAKPAVGPAPAKPAAPAIPAEEVIKLVFAMHNAQTTPLVRDGMDPYLDQIETATGGKVVIERFYSETLCRASEMMEALRSGVTTIGYIVIGYTPGVFIVNETGSIPFLPITEPTAVAHGIAMWKASQQIPEFMQEFSNLGMRPLAYVTAGPYLIHMTPKAGPIKVLEDWKGKILRVLAGPATDGVRRLGAEPIYISMPDVYIALERGTLDGALFSWETLVSWFIGETTNYHTVAPIYNVVQFIGMNQEKFSTLPVDIQDAIMSVSGEKGTEFLGYNCFDRHKEGALALLEEYKLAGNIQEVYYPPEEEVARWAAVGGEPTWDEWGKKLEAAGWSRGRAIVDDFIKISSGG